MSSQAKAPVGRPLYSRLERGYGDDLLHLSRLRSACLSDNRISHNDYLKIARSINTIEKFLRELKGTLEE